MLPKAPALVNADFMIDEELWNKIQIGLDQVKSGKILDAEQTFEDMSNIYRYIFDTLQVPIAEKQHLELRQMIVDNYSIIFTIRKESVVVLSVIYSASDIANRLKDIRSLGQ